jgi:dolichol-phosphate mannosyltransferase
MSIPNSLKIKPELTIVVPCYNEKENIRPLVALLDAALKGIEWAVLFVDDDSPDGTAQEVGALARERENVRLLHRVGRRGLAGACIEGILSSVSPIVAVMDGDLQHDETKLAEMFLILRETPHVDCVIGSRHVEGGSSRGGLSAVRTWGSNTATRLARGALRVTVSDPMSGFFMVRRLRFNEVVSKLQTQGFKILLDMLFASGGQWTIREVGYAFRTRQFGNSKLDVAVTLEFFGLILSRMTGGIFPIRFILFFMVGLTGVAVQLLTVHFALLAIDGPFYIAQSLGVCLAMTSNFTLNNLLTYRDRMLRGRNWIKGLFSFYAVCFVGAVMNVAMADLLFATIGAWVLASLGGAITSSLWNFIVSSVVTWRVR